jgi:alpha-tubulin suppressor-like RCC1 family protein
VCWGCNKYGQCKVPEGLENVVAVTCGFSHTVVLTGEGTIICWGQNDSGQCTPPNGLEVMQLTVLM